MVINYKDNLFYIGDYADPDGYLKTSLVDGVISMDSTVVKKEFGGRGYAAELTKAVIEHAKENEYKVKPVCSYSVRYFEKNPDLKDLLA